MNKTADRHVRDVNVNAKQTRPGVWHCVGGYRTVHRRTLYSNLIECSKKLRYRINSQRQCSGAGKHLIKACNRQITLKPLKVIRSRTKKVTHTRLPSVGFRSWSQFLVVSLRVMRVINPAVGCHYFPPGLQLPSQPLRGLLPISLLGEQRHDGCEQFA